MIALGFLFCLAIAILFSLLPLFYKVEERKIINIAFIVIFIGVFIYSASIDVPGPWIDKNIFIRITGIISSYVGLFINSLMLVNSLKITGGKTIVSMVYLLLIPLGFVVEDSIAEKKFNHLCKTEAGLTIYEKVELPSRYFRDATEEEKKRGIAEYKNRRPNIVRVKNGKVLKIKEFKRNSTKLLEEDKVNFFSYGCSGYKTSNLKKIASKMPNILTSLYCYSDNKTRYGFATQYDEILFDKIKRKKNS
jgi:hypothetical protein